MPTLTLPRPRVPAAVAPALARVAAKQAVVDQVIAGRLSLVEGAARFRAAAAGPARADEDGEGMCRTVIGWAELTLSDCPERAVVVAERLEEELRKHLSRPGGAGRPGAE